MQQRPTDAIDAAATATAARSDDNIWKIISSEATLLDEGATRTDIMAQYLWPDGEEPDWSHQHWQGLDDHLAQSPDEHWHVWTDWWEARRDGKPYHIEMEREVILIPDEDWKRGPAHVNALIMEIRAKHGLTSENRRGLPFGARDGVIVLRDWAAPTPEEDADLFHAALSDDATRLSARLAEYGKDEDPYDTLATSTAKVIAALGPDTARTKTSALWLGMRTLREVERIDRRNRADFRINEPPLDTEIGEALRTTLATFTALCLHVPPLQKLERANRDDAEIGGLSLEAIEPILAMVRTENALFLDEVHVAFEGLMADARSEIEGIAERGEAVTLASAENLIHRLIAEAIAEDRKGKPGPFWEAYKKKAGEHAADLTLGTLAFSAKAVIAYHFADLVGITDKLANADNYRGQLEQIIRSAPK